MKIDGKEIAGEILTNLKTTVETLSQKGITPTLAVILMGEDESSVTYIKQKKLKAEEIGADVKVFKFHENVTNEEIEKLVKELDKDPKIHGIILQRPAPKHIKVDTLEELISPIKEVDGFGTKPKYPVPVAEAVYRMILKNISEEELKTKKVVVLGKGETAGMPIINHLRKKGIEPTIVDSKTENRENILKNADVIISAVGKEVLHSNDIRKGVTLIGVGLHTNEEGKLKGDYEDQEIENTASYYSPTPGGVGPVNVSILMENLVRAATI